MLNKRSIKYSFCKGMYVWGVLRLCMGWIFFWAFIDKLFGLGFATESGKSWLDGASPTVGFLKFGTKGPFVEFFQSLAGNPTVDWLFMVGLLCIGLALLLGIGVRVASVCGIAMLVLMYLAGFMPPEHNPFLDDHVIYSIVLIGFIAVNSGDYFGLGGVWKEFRIVKKYPFLR